MNSFCQITKELKLKLKKGYSKSKITLFSANPDSMYLYALKGLVETCGVDKKDLLQNYLH